METYQQMPTQFFPAIAIVAPPLYYLVGENKMDKNEDCGWRGEI